jgi:hypothetical protein
MKPSTAWLRAFLATIFRGLAEGFIAAAGGNTAMQMISQPTFSGHGLLAIMLANAGYDVAMFVKSNSDFTQPPLTMAAVVQPKIQTSQTS